MKMRSILAFCKWYSTPGLAGVDTGTPGPPVSLCISGAVFETLLPTLADPRTLSPYDWVTRCCTSQSSERRS